MKTYIVFTSAGMIATMAENKNAAFNKVKAAFSDRKVSKTNVTISGVHIDYCHYERLY